MTHALNVPEKLMLNTPRRIPLSALPVVLALLLPVSARAQDPEWDLKENETESKVPDIENGEALAHKLCVGCHVLERGSDAAPQADVPSFPAISDRPNQTVETLTARLLAPHAPMPDPHLSRERSAISPVT
jgi:mono/diheme cytochrome c family protein